MAFKSFTPATPSLPPFLAEYASKNPECVNKFFPVYKIALTRKQSGYMLYTLDFSVHVYKKESECEHLLFTLEDYCEQGNGYALGIVPLSDTGLFEIGISDEECFLYKKKGNVTLCSPITSLPSEDKKQPLDPPVIPTITTSTAQESVRRRGKTSDFPPAPST